MPIRVRGAFSGMGEMEKLLRSLSPQGGLVLSDVNVQRGDMSMPDRQLLRRLLKHILSGKATSPPPYGQILGRWMPGRTARCTGETASIESPRPICYTTGLGLRGRSPERHLQPNAHEDRIMYANGVVCTPLPIARLHGRLAKDRGP